MAKSWSDVRNNPEFSKETPETQKAIANDYFDKVIAPQAKANGDDVEAVRADFNSKALPAPTVAPKAPVATSKPAPEKIYPVNTPPSGYDTQAPTGALNSALNGNGAPQPQQTTQAPIFPQNMGQALAMRSDAPKQAKPVTPSQVAEGAKGVASGVGYTVGRQALVTGDFIGAIADSLPGADSADNTAYHNALRNGLQKLETFKANQIAKSPERARGFEGGEGAVNIGETMLPGKVGLAIGEGLRVGGAGGEEYENTGSVGSGLWQSAKTGAADLVAHKAGKVVSKVTAPLVKQVPEQISKRAVGAVTGAATGYVGGFGAGATTALANGDEIGDVIHQGHEAGKEGAEYGAVFGYRGGKAAKIEKPTQYTPEQVKAVDTQHAKYSEATNAVQKNKILNESTDLKNHNDIQAMKDNNIPIHSAAFRDDTGASMAGVTKGTKPLSKVELNTTVKDTDGNKTTLGDQIKSSYKNYTAKAVDSIGTLKDNVSSMLKGTNSEYTANRSESTSSTATAKGEGNAPLTSYRDSLGNLHKAYKSGDTNAIKQAAEKADHDYSQLPELDKQHIKALHEEVTGSKTDMDHVADAHTFTGVTKRVNDMIPDINKPVTPETNINIPVLGHTMKAAEKGVKAVTNVLSAAKQYNTRQQLKRNTSTAEANAGTVAHEAATPNQRMILQARNHPEAANPNLSRTQAQDIIQGRDVEELAPQQPGQEKPTVNRYAEAKYSQNKQRELDIQRSKFNDPEIAKKLTMDDMRNPDTFKVKFDTLKQQDNAQNVEKIKAQNTAKATAAQNTANVKHESAMKELTRWQGEEGQFIPQEYVDRAIAKSSKQTPEGARVLDASRVKSYAMRDFESNGAKLTGKKDQFYHAIQHDLPDAVKAQAKQHVDRLFANKQSLKPEEARQAWKDVYEMGAEHHETAGNKTLANTMRKVANQNVNTLHARELAVTRSHVSKAMKNAFKTTHENIDESNAMNKQEQQDFIDHELGKAFEGRKVAMSRTEVNDLVQRMKEKTATTAKQWASKSEAQKASDLGADEASVAEIDKHKPGKMNADDSKHVLTDIKNNYTDAIVNGGDVRKLLATNKGIVNHLDQSGGKVAMHNRFEGTVENIANRKDNMPKGFDKRSLVSREEYDHISGGNAQGYKSDLLTIAGVKDRGDLLPESERSTLESDIKLGKQATREKQQQNKASMGALREKLDKRAAKARTNQPRVIRPKR